MFTQGLRAGRGGSLLRSDYSITAYQHRNVWLENSECSLSLARSDLRDPLPSPLPRVSTLFYEWIKNSTPAYCNYGEPIVCWLHVESSAKSLRQFPYIPIPIPIPVAKRIHRSYTAAAATITHPPSSVNLHNHAPFNSHNHLLAQLSRR